MAISSDYQLFALARSVLLLPGVAVGASATKVSQSFEIAGVDEMGLYIKVVVVSGAVSGTLTLEVSPDGEDWFSESTLETASAAMETYSRVGSVPDWAHLARVKYVTGSGNGSSTVTVKANLVRKL